MFQQMKRLSVRFLAFASVATLLVLSATHSSAQIPNGTVMGIRRLSWVAAGFGDFQP
jgi:hypothetical protein